MCTRFGPPAPQVSDGGLTNAGPVDWNEDCLTLNVCTPAVDDRRRPVMVWIHGGGYRNGTGAIPWYDGSSFAANGDIVTVTINYRLGALGFVRLDGEPLSGINGTLDQIAALEWVRDNIAAFGGDPGRVTVAGESAGAFSVGTLLAMPAAAGLFHQAILQSGGGHHVRTEAQADDPAERFCDFLGTSSLAELREIPVERILEAQVHVEKTSGDLLRSAQPPFYPSITSGYLDARPIDLMQDGASADIPVLIGTNTDETSLFGMNKVSSDKLESALGNYGADALSLIAAVETDRPGATASEIAVAVSSDHMFRIPAIRVAEAREPHGAKTWMYEFGWKSRAFDGALGATHALEIPFAYGTLDAKGTDVFLGTSDVPVELGALMHEAWTGFIATGSPVTADLPGWETYTSERRTVQRFGEPSEITRDPWPAARLSWDGHR